MIRSAPRWRVYAIAAALCGLVAAGCDGDDEADRSAATDPNTDTSVELGGDEAESGPPDVDACALGADTIRQVLPYAEPKPSSGETEGYDCLWRGDDPDMYSSVEVSLAMWDSASYSTLDEMRVDFETSMTTFRPVRGLGEEGWFKTSFMGNEVSWRTADFTVSLGGIVNEGVTDEQLLRIARAIDADLPGSAGGDPTETESATFEVDACTLGPDAVEQLLGTEVEARPLSDSSTSRCTWGSIEVYVSAYEPTTFLNTFGGHPVTGLGDEAYASVGANGDLEVAWHDGTYVVEVEMVDGTLEVTEDQLLDLAAAIDDDLPDA